jgi:hypothetical protein
MSNFENRFVIRLEMTDLFNDSQYLYIVTRSGVDQNSLIDSFNIDFISTSLDLSSNRIVSSMDNYVTEHEYDIKDIDTEIIEDVTHYVHPFYSENFTAERLRIDFSTTLNDDGDKSGLPFIPDDTYSLPYDIKCRFLITNPFLTFNTFGGSISGNVINNINPTNLYFTFFYQKGDTKLPLNFSSLTSRTVQQINTLNEREYQIKHVNINNIDFLYNELIEFPPVVVIPGLNPEPEPAPAPAPELELAPETSSTRKINLTELFRYSRSYKSLNNQKKFETYDFLNIRNKLRK